MAGQTDRPIEPAQVKLIHVGVSKLRMEDETYRHLLKTRYGAGSCKELTYGQASDLLDSFRRFGFRIKPKGGSRCRAMCEPRKRPSPLPANVVLLVSPEQLSMIGRLKGDIRWRVWDGFDRWLKKYFGVEGGMKGIRDSRTATKVIEALKGMWRAQNCACGLAKRKGA